MCREGRLCIEEERVLSVLSEKAARARGTSTRHGGGAVRRRETKCGQSDARRRVRLFLAGRGVHTERGHTAAM
eukprot:1092987-Pyramimonas_sp.AAC.2